MRRSISVYPIVQLFTVSNIEIYDISTLQICIYRYHDSWKRVFDISEKNPPMRRVNFSVELGPQSFRSKTEFSSFIGTPVNPGQRS